MLNPIYKDHEIICPCGCGCVLSEVAEQPTNTNHELSNTFNKYVLGSAIVNNKNYHWKDKEQVFYEKGMTRMLDLVREFSLPEAFAIDVMNKIRKNRRGLYSEREQFKQLIKILSKDDNYLYIHKMRAIKAKYEKIINR